jgi:hypothetical protein
MVNPRKKLENAYTEEEKRSHLPCAGIILFRFYGYYLSQMGPAFSGDASAPREL